MLRAPFVLHPVGQGLFYTGSFLRERARSFNFVYDCGSNSSQVYLNNQIKLFKSKVNGNTLDLLVISHLDRDHCNGLKALLLGDERLKVKYAIMPYLSKIERLMIIARTRMRADWIYGFLADPVDYLLQKGVDKVVLFSPSERQGQDLVRTPEILETDDGVPRIDDDSFEFTEDITAGVEAEQEIRDWQTTFKGRVLTRSTDGYLNLNVWFFSFFCVKPENTVQEEFRKKVEDKFGKHWRIHDFKDKRKRKQLRELYEELCKKDKRLREVNNSSLISLHRSLLRNPRQSVFGTFLANLQKYSYIVREMSLVHERLNPSWLLTGDANFKRSSIYNEVIKHFGLKRNPVTSVLVPHHGSANSWNRNLRSIGLRSFYISAGINNKYNHPSNKVIQAILSRSKLLLVANELYGAFEHWTF